MIDLFVRKDCALKQEFTFRTLQDVLNAMNKTAHKRFTYVAKTRANLTTYSRKPENYNGTIIFEIDIMKNSSPINLNLCQTWLFHNCFGCFFCFDLLWAELRVQSVQQKRIAVLVLTWQKVWILNWVGMSFSWCQSQK